MGSDSDGHGPHDVVVIGAGLGGLSCAALLAERGLDVAVFERNSAVGGACTSFRRDGFRFDAGPIAFKECGEGEDVRNLLQGLAIWEDLSMVRPDPGLRVVGEGYDLGFPAGLRFYDRIAEHFPGERDALARFERSCVGLQRELDELLAIPPDLMSVGQKIALVPKFIFGLKHLKRFGKRTGREVLDGFFTDGALQGLFASLCPFPLEVNGALFMALVHGAAKDFHYPRGGSQALADAIGAAITRKGGTVRTGAEVAGIGVEAGTATGVKLADGSSVPCRFVVSNADARHTFFRLVGREHLPDRWTGPLDSDPVAFSYLLVSLGVDRDLRGEGHVAPLLCLTRCCDLDRIWGSDVETCPVQVRIPTLVDESLAPPGHSIVQILASVPYDGADCWGREEDGTRGTRYRTTKEEVADRLVASVEKIVPGLSRHVVCRDVATPLTYERYTLCSGGASGWLPLPGGRMRSQKTPVRNLFQAGQWTYPGAGVPTVFASGRAAADLVLREVASTPR